MTRSAYVQLAIFSFVLGTVFAFGDRFLLFVVLGLGFFWGCFRFIKIWKLQKFNEGKISLDVWFKSLGVVMVFLTFSFLGSWRFVSNLPKEEFSNFYGQQVSLDGLVVEEVEIRPKLKMIVLRPDNFSERILVQYRGKTEVVYGDRVWVRGVVSQPEAFRGFDYPNFLKTKDITALMQNPKVIVLKTGMGNSFIAYVLDLKKVLVESLERHIQKPSAQVVLGLLLGDRSKIDESIRTSFQESGLSHLLSVSGFNITIIVLFLGDRVNRYLGVRRGLWVVLGFVFLFSIMAGLSASVVRASLMGVMLCLARVVQRPYAQGMALVLAGFVMVFAKPLVLFYDVGFQLSFMATIGLITLTPVFEKIFRSRAYLGFLREYLFTSLSAMVSTLPLIFYVFGEFNLMSVVANLMILPLVPLVMLVGFLSVLPVVGFGFGLIAHVLVGYMVLVSRGVAGIVWARVDFDLGFYEVVVLYIVLVLVVLGVNMFFEKKKKIDSP